MLPMINDAVEREMPTWLRLRSFPTREDGEITLRFERRGDGSNRAWLDQRISEHMLERVVSAADPGPPTEAMIALQIERAIGLSRAQYASIDQPSQFRRAEIVREAVRRFVREVVIPEVEREYAKFDARTAAGG